MKVSIVVSKTLSAGQKTNVAAIIMGQLALNIPALYSNVIQDASGSRHAGISMNLVVLDGGGGQLLSLIERAQKSDVTCVVFSAIGQSLSNNYQGYRHLISSLDTASTNTVGVGLAGEDSVVKHLTKKFSLIK